MQTRLVIAFVHSHMAIALPRIMYDQVLLFAFIGSNKCLIDMIEQWMTRSACAFAQADLVIHLRIMLNGPFGIARTRSETLCTCDSEGKRWVALKAPITTAADDKVWDIFPNFQQKQQTILMKYHALFVIFEKAANFLLSSAANYRWRFNRHEKVQDWSGFPDWALAYDLYTASCF